MCYKTASFLGYIFLVGYIVFWKKASQFWMSKIWCQFLDNLMDSNDVTDDTTTTFDPSPRAESVWGVFWSCNRVRLFNFDKKSDKTCFSHCAPTSARPHVYIDTELPVIAPCTAIVDSEGDSCVMQLRYSALCTYQGDYDGRGQRTASPMLTAIMSGGVGISGRELYKYR